jgi:enoyl-CoA hydratase/carnithine racemase
MTERSLISLGRGIVGVKVATDDEPYLDAANVGALSAALQRAGADGSIKVVVLLGEDRYFCAGARREDLLRADGSPPLADYVMAVPRLVLSVPVPIVAAMSGHAIGGGFTLGLWCDTPVLAEESLYGANFMALGFTPGMGTTALLEQAMGGPLGREMLLTGRLLKGREILQGGGPLSSTVRPKAEVASRALEIAHAIAEASRNALVLLKQSIVRRRKEELERALLEERAMHESLFADPATRLRIADKYPGGAIREETR